MLAAKVNVDPWDVKEIGDLAVQPVVTGPHQLAGLVPSIRKRQEGTSLSPTFCAALSL